MTSADPEPEMALQGERVSRLKEQIERRKYRVDSEAVAHEILFKLRMIHLGRRGMLGTSPPDGEGPTKKNSQGR